VRHIYAITTMNGEITSRQLVASYRAPAEPEPSMVPALIAQRVGSGVQISWGASHAPVRFALPTAYDVDVNISDGRRLLDVMSGSSHQVTIPNVARNLQVKVAVGAVRRDDTQGPMRSVTLPPGSSAT
jgi:hypothetical protein